MYSGRVLVKRYTSTRDISSLGLTPGLTTYIIQAPILGDAFAWAQDGGTNTWTFVLVRYADVATMFPQGNENANATAFRIASNSIEIIPTGNSTSVSGSISVWKGPFAVTSKPGGSGYNVMCASGFDGVLSTKPSTVLPFSSGCYASARPSEPVVPFVPVMTDTTNGLVQIEMPPGITATLGLTAQQFLGAGHLEATIIQIPAFSATANACMIRTWSCVEMQVSSYSALYEYQHISPPYDPLALQLLIEFFNSHPVAVSYYDNESFWKSVLAWIREVSGTLSVLPGPYGRVASGVNMIANAF